MHKGRCRTPNDDALTQANVMRMRLMSTAARVVNALTQTALRRLSHTPIPARARRPMKRFPL